MQIVVYKARLVSWLYGMSTPVGLFNAKVSFLENEGIIWFQVMIII